ncbi:MAG TPA: ABC transporter permease, partial [Chloroflexota bacterium]|nr:ABC transporter permease [Chloroflexota bacterium]
RRLWRRMAERDLRQRYVGSALGLAWTALSPLLFVAVYVSIFTFVFGARLGGDEVGGGGAPQGGPDAPTVEYALYVLSGLLPWVAFSDVAGRATQTMAEHRNLVKYAVFPVQILPLTSLYAVSFSQGIGLVLVLLLSAWLGGGLPSTLWLLPLVLLLQILFLAGVAWLLGALGAILRDVKEVVQLTLMVGMFLTPIFYLEQSLPPPLRLVLELNPLTHLVRLYRGVVLGPELWHSASLPVFALIAVATLLAGFLAFERTRTFLSDIL